MSVLRSAVRPGAYRDSIVLMRLRGALRETPGVEDAGAVMASRENLAILEAAELLPEPPPEAGPGDLLVVVRAEDERAAGDALSRLEGLLAGGREGAGTADGYRPRTVEAALRQAPAARWVLVSVAGRWAARVARTALERDRHVFLYSDNVPPDEEVALKRAAAERGLLLLGPDCGTAMVGGIGFGFANRVRPGPVGLVGASGTGLQAVSVHLHALGTGVSHIIGTGSRDPSAGVGGVTTLQGLGLLAADPDTEVIVLVSKPPAPAVAARVLDAARACGKPVVACLLGGPARTAAGPGADPGGAERSRSSPGSGIRLAAGTAEAARIAAALVGIDGAAVGADAAIGPAGATAPARGSRSGSASPAGAAAAGPPWLRGLFAGGTLALEAIARLDGRLPELTSNVDAPGLRRPDGPAGHRIIDLGADEYTGGRLHPMIDPELRLRWLAKEAAEPGTGVVLLDVVLGDGAHPDPAAALGPAVREARRARPELEVVAIVLGTDQDPQDAAAQVAALEAAGARVFRDVGRAVEAGLRALGRETSDAPRDGGDAAGDAAADRGAGTAEDASAAGTADADGPAGAGREAGATGGGPFRPPTPVPAEALRTPAVVVNVGLEAFADSLAERGVEVVRVDWRPPAGGDERLAAALERLR